MEVGQRRTFEISRMIFYSIEIKIIFQSMPPDRPRSMEIPSIQVKYQAISFPIPNFPSVINIPTKVNIIVQQGNTLLNTLEYTYLPPGNSKHNLKRNFFKNSLVQCETCQRQANSRPRLVAQISSNKRTKSHLHTYDDESDALVPTSPISPVFEQTTPEPVSSII